ncbi:MAG TPA: lipocalin-like domain-containing protein [Parvularculaceae bacterium]|nr:lipocalin-like domain-containing protein [Parvularculaceae bacterium]
MTHRGLTILVCAAGMMAAAAGPALSEELSSLEGTWVMDAAYEVRADGARTNDFGEHPEGLLIVDHAGRYSLQVFKVGRPPFASGDRSKGTPEEYRAALVGISTHIGRVTVDKANHQLIFNVEAASFPNWEGKQQVRTFTYQDGLLSYAVPAYGASVTAYSVWRRATQ